MGTYNFTVTVEYVTNPAVFATASFSIILVDCSFNTLDIDEEIWQDVEYKIYDIVKTLTWTPKETGIAECGSVSWSLGMTDGGSLDEDIFTSVNFSSETKTLVIYSSDESKTGIYDM